MRENINTYAAELLDSDPLPFHVEAAFREYLRCGVLAYGWSPAELTTDACGVDGARAYCASCHHDFLVAFSCKGRDICPSCATRRMVETAAHLVDDVLPRVPYRQWVLSVPKRVRWHLRHKPEVVSGLLRVFLRAVETTLRQASPGAPPGARLESLRDPAGR